MLTQKNLIALKAWLETPLGQAIVEAEVQALDRMLPKLFGYHLAYIGPPTLSNLLAKSRVYHHTLIYPGDYGGDGFSHLPGLPEALPLRTESVEVVVLYHTLEFAENPHEVLREAYRVLTPEGRLLIVGFNACSFFGIRQLIQLRRNVPWRARPFFPVQLNDWLKLLGFDVLCYNTQFFRLPIAKWDLVHRGAWMDRLGARVLPFFGASYCMLSLKQVKTLTPIKPKWSPSRLVAPLIEPAPRTRVFNDKTR